LWAKADDLNPWCSGTHQNNLLYYDKLIDTLRSIFKLDYGLVQVSVNNFNKVMCVERYILVSS
jgi:hypothetical protein